MTLVILLGEVVPATRRPGGTDGVALYRPQTQHWRGLAAICLPEGALLQVFRRGPARNCTDGGPPIRVIP